MIPVRLLLFPLASRCAPAQIRRMIPTQTGKVKTRKARLLEYLSSAIEQCPVLKCNPEDCPIHEMRTMPPKLQKKWLKAVGEDFLTGIASYHKVCVKTRCFTIRTGNRPR